MASVSSETPAILDGKFFSIITQENGKVKANCQACIKHGKRGSEVEFGGRLNVTSNFTTHLKRKHPELLTEYEEYKKELELRTKRQKTIQFPVLQRSSAIKTGFERALVDFIVMTMSPLSTVDNKWFKRLVHVLNSEVDVPCDKTLKAKITFDFDQQLADIKSKMAVAPYVCCTADIWSGHHRSYMGMTAHWLLRSANGWERKSAILCLKRFAGHHTSDKIADMLFTILKFFNIQNKTVAVVTDNGSNFVKAFKEYGITEGDEDANLGEDEEIIEQQFGFEIADEEEVRLPPHIRCASHTLSLVATTDLKQERCFATARTITGNAVPPALFKKTMRSAFAKTTALWNKLSRSTLVSDKVTAITKKVLIRPVVTRWNSMFDAIRSLLEFEPTLTEIFTEAEVEALNEVEIRFLKDYNSALKPIAWALDTLQSEAEFYYGYLAPVITIAANDLRNIIKDNAENSFSTAIAIELLGGLEKRFPDIMQLNIENAKNEILAAILLPWFKLSWIPSDRQEEFKNIFIEEAKAFQLKGKQNPSAVPETPASSSKWDKYFGSSNCEAVTPTVVTNIEVECVNYLRDTDKSLLALRKYPGLSQMFEFYNTPLPSSAASERAFSTAKMILRPNRCRLGDEMFEKLVFLKLNNAE